MSNGCLPNVSPRHPATDGGGGAAQEPVCGVRTSHLNLCDSSSQKRVHFGDQIITFERCAKCTDAPADVTPRVSVLLRSLCGLDGADLPWREK